jgi:transposase InsO family protein
VPGKEDQMKVSKYTPEEIKRLRKLPGVSKVTSRRVFYEEEFRKALYDEWLLNPSKETIRKVFIARGAELQESDETLITNLHRTFIQQGRPEQNRVYVKKNWVKQPELSEESEQVNTKAFYSDADIERLKKLPGVITVTPRRIVFDLEFKQMLYDAWYVNPSVETIRKFFIERGGQLQESDDHFIENMQYYFRKTGRPKQQMIYHGGDERPHKTVEDLIEEGVLYRTFSGVRITPSYLDMLKKAYWDANGEKTIEEIVVESGYTPYDLGQDRLIGLRKRLEKKAGKQNVNEQMAGMDEELGKTNKSGLIWTKNQIEDTPYIRKAKEGCLELTEAFFNDAIHFRGLPLTDILSIYGIPEDAIPGSYYKLISERLSEWEPTGEVTTFDLPVAVNRFVAMRRLLEQTLAEAKEQFQQRTPPEKKAACEMIDTLPRDAAGEYTTQAIREKLGISQTSYYKYLRRERYGMQKSDKALSDIAAVRKVFDYKGFKKGSRQIDMLMPKVVGRKMGLKKIRRIMRENGMESDIRTPNMQKRAMEEYLKENRKPNLLDRRFRLYRPNQVRLTDVTYIDYGPKGQEKRRAYGSASIDPVTGKLIAFVVMENNDQKLADATLREMDNFPCEFGGKFHSDQGTLYLMPEFQAKVAERGFDQSMSRRSNCWDNAPQESFFGHFKDECDYASCETIDELRDMIEGYKYYFNYERGMWDRMQKTPVEYESYLSSLSDEEFQKYLDEEELRYREMKAESIRKAKARAKELGAYESEDIGTEDDVAEGGGEDE